jgi:hypothetical protein
VNSRTNLLLESTWTKLLAFAAFAVLSLPGCGSSTMEATSQSAQQHLDAFDWDVPVPDSASTPLPLRARVHRTIPHHHESTDRFIGLFTVNAVRAQIERRMGRRPAKGWIESATAIL